MSSQKYEICIRFFPIVLKYFNGYPVVSLLLWVKSWEDVRIIYIQCLSWEIIWYWIYNIVSEGNWNNAVYFHINIDLHKSHEKILS